MVETGVTMTLAIVILSWCPSVCLSVTT